MSENWILLVEDNANDAELTMRALKKGGISTTVVVAHDGAEALDYLLQRESTRIEIRRIFPRSFCSI